ncbi:CerR family C-terminal domain-containing protein [Caulobacter hibisci]|uniref:CerR family C-terminal domain-containing protein n=1 Tax=Caulobacter hibisci TaxID=2035993 RepID=A0ABS0T040_9CAUL|nr:CerR family C-terminal domain-containing protein [Caulobacter hibisci]MBI1685164.1 CerR family C-terminal domain-containing protein [Caulobacter hibisci]
MDDGALPPPALTPPEPSAGYRKGGEARARILTAALAEFGEHGFKAATTRQIAEAAGVKLPALKYYFGGKRGLYLACARQIIDVYAVRMLPLVSEAHAALASPMSSEDARARLKAVLRPLAELLVGAGKTPDDNIGDWTGFVLKEMTQQGPAFDILHGELWAPGVELTAGLIARVLGQAETGQSARLQALMLISSLSAFSVVRPIALKVLAWPDAGAARFEKVVAQLEAQVDALGR